MKIVTKGIGHTEDGHYDIPLPLKDLNVGLPSNREMTFRRLKDLKEDLLLMLSIKRTKSASWILSFKMIRLRKPRSLKKRKVISKYGISHSKKPNKLQVVFNCSTELEGNLLNNHLQQGLDITNNLTGVLCRFLKEVIAYMCDVEEMFHQVKVNEECGNLLHFLL